MGRRKIEIKAIKDDRNRSVTFLKRKGGLFKKAHELSVLCSVDVAVIIFGQNGKLYTYSSAQIRDTVQQFQYHQGQHEHKGPSHFQDKDAGDEEDDDEQAPSPGADDNSPPQMNAQLYYPNQQAVHHLRHGSGPSHSPQLNGNFGPVRVSSPQPQNHSRPTSRTQHRRVSSNIIPQTHLHPQVAAQMQMGYQQNQYFQRIPAQLHPSHSTPHLHPHLSAPAHQQTFPQMAQHSQMQQIYMQEQRRQSMPPSYPSQIERPQSVPVVAGAQLAQPFQSPPLPDSPRYNQMDTGADQMYQEEERMMQWNTQEGNGYGDRLGARSQSVDTGSTRRAVSASPRPPAIVAPGIQRARSPLANFSPQSSQTSPTFPGERTDRPRLTVQIPADAAGEEGGSTAEASTTSPENGRSGNASESTPSKATANNSAGSASASNNSHSKSASVVLPPPSPSQPTSGGAVLSPGATGPPNPFARPPPPASQHPLAQQHPHALNTNIPTLNTKDSNGLSATKADQNLDTPTPVSALPSRFMSSEGLLPSPSSFYPEWALGGFGSGNLSAGGPNSAFSPTSGLGGSAGMSMFQPTPVRESSGTTWDKDKAKEENGNDKMDVDEEKLSAEDLASLASEREMADLERKMKRKVISPTDGEEDRGKRGRGADLY